MPLPYTLPNKSTPTGDPLPNGHPEDIYIQVIAYGLRRMYLYA